MTPKPVTRSTSSETDAPLPPNHHAEHHQPTAPIGYLGAFAMLFGRRGDAQRLCELVLDGSEEHVVDLGCGPGLAVLEAARTVPRVTGVDPAHPMLRFARALTQLRARRRPSGHRVEWVVAGAEDLPLADNSASVCWSVASVHHWPHLTQGVREAGRILVPGGRFVAVEKQSWPGAKRLASHGWTTAQAQAFADLLAACGFTDIETTNHDAGRHELVMVQGRAA